MEEPSVNDKRDTRTQQQMVVSSDINNASKNDWETDGKMAHNPKIGASTFVRVIMIRRILVNDMPNIMNDNGRDEYIKSLTAEIKDLQLVIHCIP